MSRETTHTTDDLHHKNTHYVKILTLDKTARQMINKQQKISMKTKTNAIMQKDAIYIMHDVNAPPKLRSLIDSCFPYTFWEQSDKHKMIFRKLKTQTS